MADPDDRRQPSPRPAEAIAEQGVVLLDGPQGAVVALTPEAAVATSENLRRAAFLAAQTAQRDRAERSRSPASERRTALNRASTRAAMPAASALPVGEDRPVSDLLVPVVAIPAKNEEALLPRLIAALGRQTVLDRLPGPLEVIIVLNNTTDRSLHRRAGGCRTGPEACG